MPVVRDGRPWMVSETAHGLSQHTLHPYNFEPDDRLIATATCYSVDRPAITKKIGSQSLSPPRRQVASSLRRWTPYSQLFPIT